MEILGIDIGRSAIKYGLVRPDGETKVSYFHSVSISPKSQAESYAAALDAILQAQLPYQAVGIGFPCVIRENTVRCSDLDFDGMWRRVKNYLQTQLIPCYAINDADAAGMAEISRAEAGDLRKGVSIVLTLGTGIGSAIFLDGKLLPNTELGLIEMHGMPAEKYAASSVINRESLSILEWASRLQEYLAKLEQLINPDHLVLGGGISVEFEQYRSRLKTSADLVPAHFRNQAGVVGAATYAFIRFHQAANNN